jgi:heterotetrameric sarcosine oxidase delta subunit
MLLITCPHCGPRAQAEFVFERPLESIVTPNETLPDLVRKLYTRDNPRGPSWELWRHTYGCQAWLKLHRDTQSHVIHAVLDLTTPTPNGGDA